MKFGQVDDMDLVNFKLPIIDEETKTILSNLKTSSKLKFYFGAPGWSDQKFKGLIYPAKTPAKTFFESIPNNLIVLKLMQLDMVFQKKIF